MFCQCSQPVAGIADGLDRRRNLLRQRLADGGARTLRQFRATGGHALADFRGSTLQLRRGGFLRGSSFLALLRQVAGKQRGVGNELFHP